MPVKTGLAFLPLTGLVMISSGVANTVLMSRVSPRILVPLGLLIAAAGMALLTRIDLHSSYLATILPPLLLLALGLGLVFGCLLRLRFAHWRSPSQVQVGSTPR